MERDREEGSTNEMSIMNEKRCKGTERAKADTWETLVASAKNFFISSSVNTTFIADPLRERRSNKTEQVSFLCVSKQPSKLDIRVLALRIPDSYRLSKHSPDSNHLLPFLAG